MQLSYLKKTRKNVSKRAVITGITGQDGSYLTELLIEKGYEVHGIQRRTSMENTQRLAHLISNPNIFNRNLFLHYGDMTDATSLTRVLQKTNPDEVYNLAAQSHVKVSFDTAEYTANADALGTLRLLDAIKSLNLTEKCRFYQASTSELYGLVQSKEQNENTPFHPRSPYAIAKLYAHWITINYREAYGMYACNGILFNHESERRGAGFVTRKITLGLSKIFQGKLDCLYLGNINAKRDWGHAKDYVEMQWLMLQQDTPRDYVIATGHSFSVKNFIEKCAEIVGCSISWQGSGLKETGTVSSFNRLDNPLLENLKLERLVGQQIIKIDPYYFRPAEVENLLGDASKASEDLGWHPKRSFDELVREMLLHDLKTQDDIES